MISLCARCGSASEGAHGGHGDSTWRGLSVHLSQRPATAEYRSETLSLEPVRNIVEHEQKVCPQRGVRAEAEEWRKEGVLRHDRAVAQVEGDRRADPAIEGCTGAVPIIPLILAVLEDLCAPRR